MPDFSDTSYSLSVWQTRLGLDGWDIRFAPEWLDEDDGEDANVRFRTDEKVAVVRIRPKVQGANRERLVVHELVHVLLKDYTELANESVARAGKPGFVVMDVLHDLEEVICNRIATALTGQVWIPTNKKEKVWFAPFAMQEAA